MKHLLLFAIILLAACSNSSHSPATNLVTTEPAPVTTPAAKDTFKTGEVIMSVALHGDNSQSYALYLPGNYTPGSKLPVMIFFDPHGDGSLPVKQYKDLAENFHYVLMGSNSSKNGMAFTDTKPVADNLVNEAISRFVVDESRITLCGFSGGAKVALLSGSQNNHVSAIIYAGAVENIQPNHPISLLGFAGTRDMNYSDEVLFQQALPGSLEHYLIEWNGKHEWPSTKVFTYAFNYPLSSIPPNTFATVDKKKSDELMAEDNIKQELLQDLQTKDLNWWKKKIADLNQQKKTRPEVERLIGYVSLACYSFSNNALKQNNLPVAERILAIYAIADPTNEDCKKFTEELSRRKSGK